MITNMGLCCTPHSCSTSSSQDSILEKGPRRDLSLQTEKEEKKQGRAVSSLLPCPRVSTHLSGQSPGWAYAYHRYSWQWLDLPCAIPDLSGKQGPQAGWKTGLFCPSVILPARLPLPTFI